MKPTKPYTDGVIAYTGNKSKLLKHIIPLIPKHTRLVDCCAGGLSVTLNTSNNVLSNDIDDKITGIYQWLSGITYEEAISVIEKHIKDNGLSNDDKDAYVKFRAKYNECQTPDKLLVLIYHSFSNQMNFNSSGKFTKAFGYRTFNSSSKKKLQNFYNTLANKTIEFSNKSFFDLEIYDDDFVYIDPPYLATGVLYTRGWTPEQDKQMMDWLDTLNARGIKFAMSNVFEHRGLENPELKEWAKKYKVHYFDKNYVAYVHCAKNQDKPTVEVYITNA